MGKPRVTDVLLALAGAFESRGWHGPSVLEALDGVTTREAARRPGSAHHSIHQLVEHIRYWEEAGLSIFTRPAEAKPRRRDWGRPTTSFAASRQRLERTHARLVAAVRRLEDADLARPVKTVESGVMLLVRVLHGIAAHDAYHAGQIRLLRTLL
jgi:uncharacterized damage-inducible protein DinB